MRIPQDGLSDAVQMASSSINCQNMSDRNVAVNIHAIAPLGIGLFGQLLTGLRLRRDFTADGFQRLDECVGGGCGQSMTAQAIADGPE